MKTLHSRQAVADQIRRIQKELDQLSAMVSSFDPSLPPEDWINAILEARRRRERIFDRKIFSDPGWDILLELYFVHLAKEQIIISDLCNIVGIAVTTGLRWVGQLERAGLIVRTSDPNDSRCIFVRLSGRGLAAMNKYFREPKSAAVAV